MLPVKEKIDQTPLQRACGAIDLMIVDSKLERFYQSGSAKIFMPKTYAKTIEAVLVNTAGGLTGGDEFEVKIGANGRTHLTISTQTAERVYRALGLKTAKMQVDIKLNGSATLHWLPQETILFDGAGFSRQLNVEIDEDASFLACETMVFGRTAMLETVKQGKVSDQWRISLGGRLIHAEALRLEGQVDQKLANLASAGGNICFSTALCVSRDAELKAKAARAFFKNHSDVETAISAWDGKFVVRSLCGKTARLKKLMAQYIEQFRCMPNPRVWND